MAGRSTKPLTERDVAALESLLEHIACAMQCETDAYDVCRAQQRYEEAAEARRTFAVLERIQSRINGMIVDGEG